ncbi:innexin inx2-like [Argiope bruennichi]|uniref:Innexin n=1 Tax=Argiope bruennichi TaxID=94029 RepID=A0A8T0G4R4_ARGBR|nr:innexin inx2-like [Argiope bruennichi]KAF8796849.1 Innexin inx2 like protein [Argiope bruennichi]
MDKLFGDLKGFFKTGKCVIDSFVARLHYRFTLVVLIAFSIAVTGRQYIGDPIDCISKDDIPNELLDTYCWIHTTFSVEKAWHKEVGKEVPYPGVAKHVEGDSRVYHAYYQWVCFVLFLQALLFYVPRYIWKNTENHKIQNLVMEFNSPIVTAEKDKEGKNEKTDLLVGYLEENIGNHTFYSSMYVLTELMNFANVVGQIFLMDTFLGGEFTTYGTNVLSFTEWDYSLRYDPMIRVFPRMTKCTFYRYGSSGDVQKHDAMCLIPINILNEKIYIFLWFWFIILATLTALELIYRAAVMVIPPLRFYILHAKCRKINEEHLKTVLSRCDRDDWFVLSLLCKNMTPCNFKIIIRELALRLTHEKMI